MDMLVQCPVCSLFLHSKISLDSHLDLHPKGQVIKALCSVVNISDSGTNTKTAIPPNSDSSIRTHKSQTAAAGGSGQDNDAYRNADHHHHSAGTASGAMNGALSGNQKRTRRSIPSPTVSQNYTSGIRMVNETSKPPVNSNSSSSNLVSSSVIKADKMQQTCTYPVSDYGEKYILDQELQGDRVVKYSSSAVDNALKVNNVFSYSLPTMGATIVKHQPKVILSVMNKRNKPVRADPKPSNKLNVIQNNIEGKQHLEPGIQSMHGLKASPRPNFIEKNVQNSMTMKESPPSSQVQQDTKNTPLLVQNDINQLSSSTFTPETIVVAQNSQYFYQEIVQNIDSKSCNQSVPTVVGRQENVSNLSQTSSICQNVMCIDHFADKPSTYVTVAPKIIPKPCALQTFPGMGAIVVNLQKQNSNLSDQNKTQVCEVTDVNSTLTSTCDSAKKVLSHPTHQVSVNMCNFTQPKVKASNITIYKKEQAQNERPASNGLKILSNIKLKAPVQLKNNFTNTVIDLTETTDGDYPESSVPPEKMLQNINNRKRKFSNDLTQPSTSKGNCSRVRTISFADLKNTRLTINKDSTKSINVDNKMDTEVSVVPDLICQEKHLTSNSELSESGNNFIDLTTISCKPKPSTKLQSTNKNNFLTLKPYRGNPIKLNGLFVKSCDKVSQIKNLNKISVPGPSEIEEDQVPSAFKRTRHVSFANNVQKPEPEQMSTLMTTSIKETDKKNKVVWLEVGQSGDYAQYTNPPKSKMKFKVVHEEVEFYSNIENTFNKPSQSKVIQAVDPLSPNSINVITYGTMLPTNFSEESSNRELLRGQESKADMDSSLKGTWSEPVPPKPYDAIVHKGCVCKGSELDVTEKKDNMKEVIVLYPNRQYAYKCGSCGETLTNLQEMRAHLARENPDCSSFSKTSSSQKKEEQCVDNIKSGSGIGGDPYLGLSFVSATATALSLKVNVLEQNLNDCF